MQYSERQRQIGERLRSARRQMKLSQEEVAGEMSVSQQTVAAWEAGRSLPPVIQLLDLCALYGAGPNQMLLGDGCCGALVGPRIGKFSTEPDGGQKLCKMLRMTPAPLLPGR